MRIVSDNIDEIISLMRKAQEEADSLVKPWQATAKPGDKFLRFTESFGEVIVIYGEILDPIEEEIEAGASEEDLEWQRANRAESHMKNYRFSRCYSQMCDEGEYGDIHVSTIATFMPNATFEEAKRLGWPSDSESLKNLFKVTGKGGVG